MLRSKCAFLYVLTILIALAPVVSGQGLPQAPPRSVGLSQQRLDRIGMLMQEHVDGGLLAGAVALVARDGKVAYLKSVGMQDKEMNVPMKPDTIFRIASMSKPITSVAVMVLYEEGWFRLSDPVSKYLPEFKDMKVLVSGPAGDGKGAARPRQTRDHDSQPSDPHLRPDLSVGPARRRQVRGGGDHPWLDPDGRLCWPTASRSSPKCRWCTSPVRRSRTASRSMSSAGWSRSFRACPSMSSCASASSCRCGWTTPASTCPTAKCRGWRRSTGPMPRGI